MNDRKPALFILVIIFVSGCRPHPDIIRGTSYFQQHKISKLSANALTPQTAGNVSEWEGVYDQQFYAIRSYPALLRLYDDQLRFLLFEDELQVMPGDYIAVQFSPIEKNIRASASKETSVLHAKVRNVRLVFETHQYLDRAQRDYYQLIKKIKNRKRLPGSRLSFPETPDWHILVDKKRNNVIVYFSVADIMFAAEVDLIYKLGEQNPARIYVNEWFKGE